MRKKEAGQRQLIMMAAGIFLGLVGIVFFHIDTTEQIEVLRRENRVTRAEVDQLKAELGDYDEIKAQREELEKQHKAIVDLETNRSGPVYLLRELAEILTRGKGPTFDRLSYEAALRNDPNSGFNPSWDTRRVWIDSFEEKERAIRIRASAKSNEDVAEFLKRLEISVFFDNVQPENTTLVSGRGKGDVKHMNFTLTANITY